MDTLAYALGAVALLASLAVAVRVGFYVGKHAPYSRSLREEVARRYRVLTVYVRAFLAVVSPAYKRRWDRQRAEARQAFRDSLVPIERAPWARDDE